MMLPSNAPVVIRARRLHDKRLAQKVVYARPIFANKGPFLGCLSGPPFFAALRDTGHLALRSWRPRSPVREYPWAKASLQRLRCFLRADAAWSCLGLARSTVSAQAARREQSGQASPFSVARICQSDPPPPDSLSG